MAETQTSTILWWLLIVLILFILVKGGPTEVTAWLRAKLLNRPTGTSTG